MFPIPFNFPFIKKNGERTTIGDAINAGGGGSQYTLPTASADTKGGVKIGSGLTMTGEVLSNNNPTPYSLPIASAETLGGVKVGSGLSITDGVLSAAGGSLTLLWENQTPTTAMAETSIELSSSDYKVLIIIAAIDVTTEPDTYFTSIIPKNMSSALNISRIKTIPSYDVEWAIRNVTFTDATHITFAQAYKRYFPESGTGTHSSAVEKNVPIMIYGLK